MNLKESKKAKESLDWYTKMIKQMGHFQKNPKYLDDSGFGSIVLGPQLGKLTFFYYDPKLKDILPHYDIFPLVLPIEPYDDSFLGLNLHYLPMGERAHLFNALLDLTNNNKFDESTKIKARYEILKKASRFQNYEKCIKKYLYSHVQSKFLQVAPTFWTTAIYLPVAQFRKGKPY